MRFDLRHQIVERLVGIRGAGARGQRKIAELRRSEREVERNRRDRQPDQRHDRRRAAQTEVRPRRQIALAVRGGQQTAADFDARGLGFGRADQARGNIAIDLGELILVDGSLAAARLRRPGRGSTARARRRSPRPSSARTQTTASSSGSRAERRFHRQAPMRRFTPPAASPAIDNCGSETASQADEVAFDTGKTSGSEIRRLGVKPNDASAYPVRVDLRSPVTAFSAARLISDA